MTDKAALAVLALTADSHESFADRMKAAHKAAQPKPDLTMEFVKMWATGAVALAAIAAVVAAVVHYG